ncbi:MAG: AAA family ATPase [Spirochaetes bacterium GWF1_31_7]|nr:MAG: AAA family ATPase [Spirochaetes bacterium GWE1_32_154]OHD49249.1 MAG: AAA family ATPase [Spirochaetes bacterium GWE2_31_10]OHD51811.1 MAG: AAA family ATPase [Spirochaetes bacterium GWF1_31_7]OHD78490.1 MAG: AAA family ATPase [Spirochaetes bacterium RIFOXYB1_FULL_32_8]HBD95331.1 AAA family ATPase [Spirochaetia bacterium]
MINRQIEQDINILKNEFPIIAILGPRQSGKTTLAKKVFPSYEYVSLEDIDYRDFAINDPRGFLNRYSKNVIFDEIQRVPHLMSYLQTHVDGLPIKGGIVITGSHNFFLMEQISQSLAGRVGITKLLPFSLQELSEFKLEWKELIFKGAYPRIYDQGIRPEVFYKNYIETYIEKDIRQIKHISKLDLFMKFIRILAGRTGQELNTNAIGDECGVSHNTIKEWISVMEASFLIYKLKPFHKNYNKRIVKNPKIYFTDTGLVCSLLGIRKKEEIDYHFLKGNLFETFIINEFVKINFNYGEPYSLYFYRDNHQKKIDLIVDYGNKQYGVEIKSSETIHEKFFDGLRYWTELTGNDEGRMYLIYGGSENMTRNKMNVVSWGSIYDRIIRDSL